MKTMMAAFKFAKGLYILPFMFYYRPGILLQGTIWDIFETVISILLGLVAFAAFWDGYLIKKAGFCERLGLLLAAIGLLFPGLIWNLLGLILLSGVFLSQKAVPGIHRPAGKDSQ